MRAPERNLTSFENRRGVQRLPPPEYIYVAPSDLPGTLRKLWRRKFLILGVTAACLAIAAISGVLMENRYGATAEVRVGVPQAHFADLQTMPDAISPNAETMETEADAAQSRAIATEAVRRLGLDEDPEFNPALRAPSTWEKILHQTWGIITLDFLRHAPPRPEATNSADRYDPKQTVVNVLLNHLDVSQEGRSHMLDVEATSENPFKAARIANTVAQLYVDSRLESRAHQNSSTGKWLDQQIARLRARVDKSERAVEDYRRKEGLYQTKQSSVTEQQLGELNTQLILAQTEMAGARAKLSDAEKALHGQKALDSVPAVLASPTIVALKQQEAEVERHAAELSSTYGPKHPEVRNALAEKRDIQRKIRTEVGRIVEGLRNEARTAEARYTALRENLAQVKGQMGVANDKSVKLHELEREADASRNLYQNFLLRYQETQAQQNFIGADSEVISLAVPPVAPTFPPRKLMLVLGGLVGLALGAFLALLSEQMDRSFRTSDEVEEEMQLPTLAMVPRVGGTRNMTRTVLKDPDSPFCQALRKLHTSLVFTGARGVPPKVVLFTSTLPGEGKSSLCVSLARLLALDGMRVVVLDCDWHRPNVHRLFGVRNRDGLSDALRREFDGIPAAESALQEITYVDQPSGAHAIFAGNAKRIGRGAVRFERLRAVVDHLSQHYDHVLIDGPPVLVGTEGLYLSRVANVSLLVIRWGRTSREEALNALRQLREVRARIAGTVLSQVSPRRYRHYGRGPLNYHYARPGIRA